MMPREPLELTLGWRLLALLSAEARFSALSGLDDQPSRALRVGLRPRSKGRDGANLTSPGFKAELERVRPGRTAGLCRAGVATLLCGRLRRGLDLRLVLPRTIGLERRLDLRLGIPLPRL